MKAKELGLLNSRSLHSQSFINFDILLLPTQPVTKNYHITFLSSHPVMSTPHPSAPPPTASAPPDADPDLRHNGLPPGLSPPLNAAYTWRKRAVEEANHASEASKDKVDDVVKAEQTAMVAAQQERRSQVRERSPTHS